MPAKDKPAKPRAHQVLPLERDLLLVFKPRGHREAAHAHAYTQRLLLVRGELEVHSSGRRRVLARPRASLTVEAGQMHATHARRHTWLLVERVPRLLRDSRLRGGR